MEALYVIYRSLTVLLIISIIYAVFIA